LPIKKCVRLRMYVRLCTRATGDSTILTSADTCIS
jgi:hypothetical protein